MTGKWFIVMMAVMLLAGCTQRGPQRPSHRMSERPQADSTQLALMELNQQLAQAADEQLLRIVQAKDAPYALYERGTWAYISDKGDTSRDILPGSECSLHMRIWSLSGQLYIDTHQRAHVGKCELPAAIDENITEWHPGAKLELYAPWYAAYGIKGTAQIPPYENIRIELEIK